MKAIITERFGSPDVLQLREVEKPRPRENEVLVRVCATTVTAGDTRMRAFRVPLSYWIPARLALGIRKPRRPIPGMELAGEIEAVGDKVTRFQPGDRVYASTLEHGSGAYAEYKCLPEDGVVAIAPANLTCEEVAAVPVGGRTALYFLRAANVGPGQEVLIYGASGSVGTFALQLASYFGAAVTAVCSTPNLEWVKRLGAHQVIDYTREGFSLRDESYDVIFDTVGQLPYRDALRALKEDGTYLQAVAAPGISLRMRWTALTSRKRFIGGGPPPDAADLDTLRELIEAGKLKPVMDRCYPLEEIAEAHRYVDTARKKGNVAICVA